MGITRRLFFASPLAFLAGKPKTKPHFILVDDPCACDTCNTTRAKPIIIDDMLLYDGFHHIWVQRDPKIPCGFRAWVDPKCHCSMEEVRPGQMAFIYDTKVDRHCMQSSTGEKSHWRKSVPLPDGWEWC